RLSAPRNHANLPTKYLTWPKRRLQWSQSPQRNLNRRVPTALLSPLDQHQAGQARYCAPLRPARGAEGLPAEGRDVVKDAVEPRMARRTRMGKPIFYPCYLRYPW